MLASFLGSAVLTCSLAWGVATSAADKPAAKARTKDTSVLMQRGQTFYERGEYRLAVAAFTEAIRINPQDPQLYNARGASYSMLGDSAMAQADFRSANELERTGTRAAAASPGSSQPAMSPTRATKPAPPVAKSTSSSSAAVTPRALAPASRKHVATPHPAAAPERKSASMNPIAKTAPSVATRAGSSTKPGSTSPSAGGVEPAVANQSPQSAAAQPAKTKKATGLLSWLSNKPSPVHSSSQSSSAEPGTIRLTQATKPTDSQAQPPPAEPPPPPEPPMIEPMIEPMVPTPPEPITPRRPTIELAGAPTAATMQQGTTIASTVGQEDIATSAPQTTAELVERAPSVNVRRTSALNLDPRIRGLRHGQVNGSASGLTLYKARVDIDALFASIDAGIVKDLTIIDGPYTSLYGPGFAFLVAELHAGERFDIPEGHGSTLYSFSTNGRHMYVRQSTWGGGPDWGYRMSFGWRNGNDYKTGHDSFEFRVPSSYQQWDGYLAISRDIQSFIRADISYLRNEKNNIELPGVIYDITNATDEMVNVQFSLKDDLKDPDEPTRLLMQYWWERAPFHGNAQHETAKAPTFYTPYVTNVFFGFTPISGGFDPSVFNLNNTFAYGVLQQTGMRFITTLGEADHTRLSLGIDWRRYEQFYQETHRDLTGNVHTIIFGVDSFGIPKSSMEDFGLLAHVVHPASENLNMTAGGRVDVTRAFVHDDAINAGGSAAGFGKPNELISMIYATAEYTLVNEEQRRMAVNAGVAYAMRNPVLAELYSDNPFVPLVRSGNSTIAGNSELTPERNFQIDVGWTGDWNFLFARARAFTSVIDNYILYTFQGNNGNPATFDTPFVSRNYQYENIEWADIYGGDMFGELLVTKWCTIAATLAYVKGTNHSPEILNADGTRTDKGAEGLPGIYPLNGTIGLRFHDPKERWGAGKWGVELLTRMVDGQQYVADSLFEAPTVGFAVFDLRGFYKVNDNLRLMTDISNLFDRTYTEHSSLAIVNPAGAFSFIKEPGINIRVAAAMEW
jgi:outer membrane receptor protein involved in Fe transport